MGNRFMKSFGDKDWGENKFLFFILFICMLFIFYNEYLIDKVNDEKFGCNRKIGFVFVFKMEI